VVKVAMAVQLVCAALRLEVLLLTLHSASAAFGLTPARGPWGATALRESTTSRGLSMAAWPSLDYHTLLETYPIATKCCTTASIYLAGS